LVNELQWLHGTDRLRRGLGVFIPPDPDSLSPMVKNKHVLGKNLFFKDIVKTPKPQNML
jgi:hypothetical protein